MKRYARQITLPQLGMGGQQKLQAASVLVIGAGGLGCPALLYLAGAGVGRIGIVDFDNVALHNLHRQVLYTMQDIGHPKALAARQHLEARNPDIHVHAYTQRLDLEGALALFPQYDVIMDATDNFNTRYLVNDCCAWLQKPLVYGSVSQLEGQVAVFDTQYNYRDLFPEPPAPGTVADCEQGGVLGVLPGIVGTLQATEAIKLVTGIGTPLRGRLWTYHLPDQSTYIIQYPGSAWRPESEAALRFLHTPKTAYNLIDSAQYHALRALEDTLVVDVRQPHELPASTADLQLPLPELEKQLPALAAKHIITICQGGIRSERAAALLAQQYPRVYSLRGGLEALQP